MHDETPKARLLELVRGHRLTDMLVVVARLGIPDLLATGAADAGTIAAATGTHAPTLYRLMRTLGSLAAAMCNAVSDRLIPGAIAPPR